MARKLDCGSPADPEFLILASLAGEPKHGYAVMNDVEQFGGIRLGPGTLYTAISRLVERGWIEPMESEGRQRPYRLTAGGAAHLKRQVDLLAKIAAVGRRRLVQT